MNIDRRNELASRAISGTLSIEEKAELEQQIATDANFADEFAAQKMIDAELHEAGSWLRNHPSLTLSSEAREKIRSAAARQPPRRVLVWWTGGVMAAAAAVAVVFMVKPNSPERSGAALFTATVAENPTTRIGIWETSPGTVKACLWIAEEKWAALPATERAALIAHLRAQVPTIRAAPQKFAGVPADDPSYPRRAAAIVALRADTYLIMGLVRQGDTWVRSRVLDEA